MKKSAFISDILFTFFTASLFSLCLFRYQRISLWLSCCLAGACGALASGAIGAILQHKRKYHFLKKSEETLKEKFSLHLVLLSDEEKTEFFKNILTDDNPEAPSIIHYLGQLQLATDKAFYFLQFTFAPVSADNIAAFSRLKTSKEKILLCLDIDNQARALCKQLQIQIKTAEDVFVLAKSKNALPACFLGDTIPIRKREKLMKISFTKNNSKRFLINGALILLASLFTPFSYYYLIFGMLLFLTATFVRIFGYKN